MKSIEDFRRDFGIYEAASEIEAASDMSDSETAAQKSAEQRQKLLRRCRERCLYLITDSEKTEARLREKLRASGKYTEDIIDETMAFLKRYDYLDDRRFADRMIQRYADSKSLSEIRQKLYQRGISRRDAEEAIADYRADGETAERRELAAVQQLLQKKHRGSVAELGREERQKLLQSLMRRGFSYSLCSRALALALEEA